MAAIVLYFLRTFQRHVALAGPTGKTTTQKWTAAVLPSRKSPPTYPNH